MHRSFSQYTQYMLCGEAYRRQYIEGDRRPIGTAGKRGLAVDKVTGASLQHKIDHGELLSTEAVAAEARRLINKTVRSEVHLTDREVSFGWKKTKAKLADVAARLASYYNDRIAPTLDPAHVQLYYEPVIPGTDIGLKMYLDVVEKDDAIRDLKTKNKSPGKGAAENSVQLALYAWAHEQATGRSSPKQTLDVLIPNATTKYEPHEWFHGESSQARALGRVVEVDHAITQEIFTPAEPDHWKCSANYCGYYHECPFGRGVAPTFFGPVTQSELIPDHDDDQIPEGPWSDEPKETQDAHRDVNVP